MVGFFSRLYGILGITFCVVACTAVVILVGLPLLLIPRVHRWKIGIWFNIALGTFFLRGFPLFARVSKKGLDNIPGDRGFLAIVNHRAAADIPLILADTRAHGISKKLVLYFPGMGQLGYLGGALFFHRRKPSERRRVLLQAIERMADGQPLHVYPEGTRMRDGKPPKVYLSLVEACHKAGIPVLPTALVGTENMVPTDILMKPFCRVSVSYLPLVEPGEFESSGEFAQYCWRQVTAEVAAMESSTSI